eukprot:6311499-Amphidinium_carterae.1
MIDRAVTYVRFSVPTTERVPEAESCKCDYIQVVPKMLTKRACLTNSCSDGSGGCKISLPLEHNSVVFFPV